MAGVSLSLACNGNSAICCGFSTLTNLSSLSSLPLEPTDKASPCAGSQFNNHSNKKGLPKVVLFYYWSCSRNARTNSILKNISVDIKNRLIFCEFKIAA